MRRLLLTILGCVWLATPAFAQEFVSSHGNWHVFTMRKGGEKLCYIASEPVKRSGKGAKNGNPYLMVTSRGQGMDEVSTSSGYTYKVDSKVKVDFGKTEFEFFTRDDVAWAYDSQQDKQAVDALKKNDKVTVKGTSTAGNSSADNYSLKGISAAYQAMKAACN